MFRIYLAALIALLPLLSASAPAQSGDGLTPRVNEVFIRIGLPVLAPFGWTSFCERYAVECAAGPDAPGEIEATDANLQIVERINRLVNHRVTPLSDREHWGSEERWDIPQDGMGDCEDYALYKRKLLMSLGMPRQALLMTVVFDQQNAAHAVLMVKTSKGDFILDNMTNEIVLWSKSEYRFVKRQSQEHPNLWVSVGPPAERYHMVAK